MSSEATYGRVRRGCSVIRIVAGWGSPCHNPFRRSRGGPWTNAGVAEGGPRPGQEKIEQHNKDNYDRYNTENALGRRQLRRRKL